MSTTQQLLAEYDPLGVGGPWETASAGLRRYILLDVFSDTPLEGNQLAVFIDGRGLEGERMQALARELRLSETVFLLAAEDEGDARARIFTPSAELPFAGHPVLGAAAVLARALARPDVVLETGAGPVRVEIAAGEGPRAWGSMSQPVPSWEPFPAVGELLAALGVEQRSGLPVEIYCNGPRYVYVELDSHEAVAALAPDLRALERCAGASGVSCFAGSGTSWRTRMFAPGLGVAEDPATGSAAGPLAVHLARHGRIEFGQEIEIVQGVEIARPSLLRARAEGTADRVRSVHVGGAVVAVAQGVFRLG
jgi:trans-2,3-dihydro-3-hydroxyanthranilate isomerase